MKLTNKKVSGDSAKEKVCKKCAEPLRSTNKRGICDNCRRKRTKEVKETAGWLLGLVLLAVPGVKYFGGKK